MLQLAAISWNHRLEPSTVDPRHSWDYLWVKHGEEVVGDRVLRVPEAAYVEQVYSEANFNALGIE
ncbi:MAG: hypothetical protein LW870_24850 [Pirellula sp.]|nr:hypothetical protein [Pirellula sp.]